MLAASRSWLCSSQPRTALCSLAQVPGSRLHKKIYIVPIIRSHRRITSGCSSHPSRGHAPGTELGQVHHSAPPWHKALLLRYTDGVRADVAAPRLVARPAAQVDRPLAGWFRRGASSPLQAPVVELLPRADPSPVAALAGAAAIKRHGKSVVVCPVVDTSREARMRVPRFNGGVRFTPALASLSAVQASPDSVSCGTLRVCFT